MQADIRFQEAAKQQWDLIVLPKGAVGAETMRDCQELIGMLAKQKADGKLVGASSAMPSIVITSINGFLQEGATCFPLNAFQCTIPKASDYDVVVHDNVGSHISRYWKCLGICDYASGTIV
jgi:protein deglycase